MNKNFKNSQSATKAGINLRLFRQKLPAEKEAHTRSATTTTTTTSLASSHMRKCENKTENIGDGSANDDSGDIVVNRIVANPCETKTQIAKISYSSEFPNSSSRIVTLPPPPPIYLTAEVFEQKRQERKNEMEEIQSHLKEIAASSPNSSVDVVLKSAEFNSPCEKAADNINLAPSSYRRCKTEGYLNRPWSATTARTVSSFHLDTLRDGQQMPTRRSELIKSNEHLPLDSAGSKRRTYDPIEARRYMKEQKKKRKRNEKENSEQKVAYEKEKIKKRLEELNKSSRAIINKNLKKSRVGNPTSAQKKLMSPVNSGNPDKNSVINRSVFGGNVDFPSKKKSPYTTENVDEVVKLSKEVSNSVDTELSLNLGALGSARYNSKDGKSQSLNVKTPRSAGRNCGIIENHWRVGLLRKPETNDHSFSAIREFSFDKENVALEMLTPKLPTTEISGKGEIDAQKLTEIYQSEKNSDRSHTEKPNVGEYSDLPSDRSKDSLEQPEAPKQPCDLPYWLRPSAVQIYPYNFIQAVRRKIESIVEPTSCTDIQQHISSKNVSEKVYASESIEKTKAANDHVEVVHSQPLPTKEISFMSGQNSQENLHKSQSTSDINSNTNLSSISFPILPSNTVSEFASLRSESIHSKNSPTKQHLKSYNKVPSNNHDDDTTISSSIFSSPEKRRRSQEVSKESKANVAELKTVSPLSLEHVEKFKIISRHTNSEDKPKGITTSESNESVDVDFNKLLSDFNHGLSQVIEANEQLKNTLDRSQKVLTPVHGSKHQVSSETTTLEEYTSDFEDTSHANTNKSTSSLLSRQIEVQQTINNQQQNKRKRKLFKVSMPLLTSPKSECDDEYNANEVLIPNVPELNLNSITPTSVHTSESANSATTAGSKSINLHLENDGELTPQTETLTPRAHEERLATIDQLKENLRRMINDSKVQRRADDRGDMTYTTRSKSESSNTTQSQSSKRSAIINSNPIECNDKSIALSTTFTLSPPKSSLATRSERTHSCASSSKPTYTKSRNSELTSRIITEDLQIQTHESTNKGNKMGNTRRSRTNQKSYFDHESYTQSHINTSRGDYTPENDRSQKSTALKEDNSIALPDYDTEYTAASLKKTKSPSSIKTVTTTTTTATSRKSGSSKVITTLRISDLEISRVSSCDGSISESSLNYSNVGLYEQLIKNETTKSEYLTAVLKMREKAILDRTKGQIAWLEVQKERYKSKGLMLQITAIRKKQRAILMKMEKEREEIKRILETTQSTLSNQAFSSRLSSVCDSPRQRKSTKTAPKLLPTHNQRRNHQHHRDRSRDNCTIKPPSSAPILRASYELEPSASLEELLRQREEDLRKRREYVERLIEWHRKLDQEETEVLNLERMLFTYNVGLNEQHKSVSSGQLEVSGGSVKKNVVLPTTEHAELAKRALEMERRLKEIDKSLRELNNISATTTPLPTVNVNGNVQQDAASSEADNLDFVRTTGSKLNKLWRRLTSQHVEKFEPNRRYKLCKSDLERLYEEAKNAVLSDFAQAEERSLAAELLDRSVSNVSDTGRQSGQQSQASYSSIGSAGDIINAIYGENATNNDLATTPVEEFNCIKVPNLNLNFSTSQSEEPEEELYVNNSIRATKMYPISKGDYSPSAAEKNFQTQSASTKSPTLLKTSTASSPTNKDRSDLIKRNMRKFLRTTAQSNSKSNHHELGAGVERSLSDTELATTSKNEHHRINGASKCSLWSAHQNENKFKFHAARIMEPSKPQTETNDLIVENLKTMSNRSTKSDTTISSSIKESVNIPSTSSVVLSFKIDEHSNTKLSPTPTPTAEILYSKVSVSEICPSEIGTSQSAISSATIVESVIATGSQASEDEVTESLKAENTSLNTDAITTDFESKSNEIATKLNKISEAVARLSQSNTLISQQSINSVDHIVEEIRIDADASGPTGTLSVKQLQHNINDDCPTYTSSFESPDATTNTTSRSPNKTEVADDLTCNAVSSPLSQSGLENHLLDNYELDFESSRNETLLDDESMPRLDATFDTTTGSHVSQEVCDPVIEVQKSNSLETLCEEPKLCESTSSKEVKSVKSSDTVVIGCSNSDDNSKQQTLQQQLMPDIINELEIRRCQQILLDSEQFRQYEHVTAVPYMYVREIPNKPPPPYCPPAHGSPMTTIFPSEERIKDITYRRTHELYCEILKTDHVNEKGDKLPSVLDEQITNIYERIILDICREYLDEHKEVLTQGDPANFHSQLAFFNPPNRLRCIQESIYKVVRRCLAMDKTSPKRTPVYSIYGHRAKRDHIGKIIIQEMYDEDEKWCNFHHEEDEVLELIIEEMIGNNVSEIAKVVLVEEGGSIHTDKVDETTDVLQFSLAESQNVENEIEIDTISATTIDESIDDTSEKKRNEEAVIMESTNKSEKLEV